MNSPQALRVPSTHKTSFFLFFDLLANVKAITGRLRNMVTRLSLVEILAGYSKPTVLFTGQNLKDCQLGFIHGPVGFLISLAISTNELMTSSAVG